MLLHLLRHAHAGDAMGWDGPDALRPLTDKGRGQADRLGAYLATLGFSSDAIITSPLVRAAQTAEIVASHLGRDVRVDQRLGGSLGLDTLDALLRETGVLERPVVVGHDPDFSELVAVLCGAAGVPMRKGALARIEVDLPLVAGAGTLRWLIPPDALKPER